MKKIIIFTLILFSLFIMNVNASSIEGFITGSNVSFRTGPGTNYGRITGLYADQGHSIVMTDKTIYPGSGCNDGWYKGEFDNKTGYVCKTFIEFKEEYIPKDPTEFENYKTYLIENGFNEPGYADLLASLHEKYPLWEFVPVATKLNWSGVVSAQSIRGKNCTYSTNQGLYSVESNSFDYLNDKFNPVDVNCYPTNYETNAYYLDPRNWLDERRIFMFEHLEYNSESQTKEAVNYMLANNANLKGYVNEFHAAATQTMDNNQIKTISPLHLASRSRVEIGNKTAGYYRVSGTYPYTYCNKTLKGYYNFYNIGSYMDSCTPDKTPSARGMAFACGEKCGFRNTYGRPWDTAQKGINGGAQFLITKYFEKGQDTIYFQKFNTASPTTAHTNQYMQNVAAPNSEGITTYNTYNNNDLLTRKIVFKIPVYLKMPNETILPAAGNPNNHLKDLKVNGTTVLNFSHDVNEYKVFLPVNTTSISIDASIINEKAKVSGIGQIKVSKENPVIEVVVTAENKSTNTYKLNIEFTEKIINPETKTPTEMLDKTNIVTDGTYVLNLKEGTLVTDLTNSLLKTNSKAIITIKDKEGNVKTTSISTGDKLIITSDNQTKELQLVVVGDGSGDGVITIADLLLVQKHILKYSNLQGSYLKAIDVNKDGIISIADLLLVQKYILNLVEF